MNEVVLMNEEAMKRSLIRLAHEIVERNDGTKNVVLLGIRRRGVVVAERLQAILSDSEREIPLGELDITLYRDDLALGCDAVYRGSRVEFPVDGKDVVLCDDVLYTGRTVRSALSAIFALGRPKSIQLLILVDRGHRELPFRADYIGKNVPTSKAERVEVRFSETDGENVVRLLR